MNNRNKQIEKQIQQIYMKVYNEVFNKNSTFNLMNGSRADIEQRLFKLDSSEKYNEFARKFSVELAKKGLNRERGIWRKYYEAAKKARHIILPSTYKSFELQVYRQTVQHNFEMIKSIPQRMMEVLNHKYTEALIEEVAKGALPRGNFAKMLSQHGVNQAKLIARTESAKLQTEITRQRASNVGAVAYEWVSSNDKRTRPSHREMNGVIVFWRPNMQQPLRDNMRGDAGCFPNCRCDAQPIVDLEELSNARYRVYNYKTDKIEWMTRNEITEAIEKGRL